MKIKHFLLLVLVFTAFGLFFNSCGGEDTDKFGNTWYSIRNTAYSMEKEIKVEGKTHTINFTIGFYSPVNGPVTRGSTYPRPYCYIRWYVLDGIPEWEIDPGRYYNEYFDITINGSGNKITEYDNSGNSGSGGGVDISETYPSNPVEYSPSIKANARAASDLISFKISPAPEGENGEIVISSVRLRPWQDKVARVMGGKYKIFSKDTKFAFDEGMREFWPTIKNTAWTKQGSSQPSIGFYEGVEGPEPDRFGGMYYYLQMPDGSFLSRGIWGRDGICFELLVKDNNLNSDFSINFTVTRSGNTLTIPQIKFPEKGWFPTEPNSDNWVEKNINASAVFNYDDSTTTRLVNEQTFNANFTGTFTLSTQVFDQGRQDLWQKVKNTIWEKSDDSTFSIVFSETGKGPSPDNYAYYTYENGYSVPTGEYSEKGYICFSKSGSSTILPFSSISKNGNKFSYSREEWKNSAWVQVVIQGNISVSNNGNTLTISNISTSTSVPSIDSTYNGTYSKSTSIPSDYNW